MLDDQVWLTAGIPVYPKFVGWGSGQDFCRPVKFFQNKPGKPFLYGPRALSFTVFSTQAIIHFALCLNTPVEVLSMQS